MKETNLYQPVKSYLEDSGFVVKAEINQADIVAVKGDYIIIVELKLSISLKLIYQAIERQKIANKVYVCLPKSVLNLRKSNVKQFVLLLKRLDIGLIGVKADTAEVLVETFGFDFNKSVSSNHKKKAKLLKEFTLRKNTVTLGGTNAKVFTHYKEKAVIILTYLNDFGPKSPKEIMAYTGITDSYSILRKNYYHWFINPKRGVYMITDLGKQDLSIYQNLHHQK